MKPGRVSQTGGDTEELKGEDEKDIDDDDEVNPLRKR